MQQFWRVTLLLDQVLRRSQQYDDVQVLPNELSGFYLLRPEYFLSAMLGQHVRVPLSLTERNIGTAVRSSVCNGGR